MPIEKKKFDYKWVILILCVLMNFVCLGFCSGNKSMYLMAITDALDIPRSLFSLSESSRYIASALVNLFFGALIARFGVRKMVGAGFVFTIASMLLHAWAEDVFTFCVGGACMGIGLAFTTTSMTGSIVRRWFTKDIGKYTGVVFAANGIGAALSAQIVSPMINELGNPFGYRNAYIFVAISVAVTGVLVVLLMRDAPKDGFATPATPAKKRRGTFWYGIDFATARKKPYFYIAAVGVLLTGVCLQGINGIYIAHLRGVGMTPELTAAVASAFSLMLTGTKILVGWIYDRFGLKTVMTLCPIMAILAYVILLIIFPSPLGMVLAFLFCALYAVAIPLETLVIPLIVNDLFGSVSYDKMLGIFSAVNYAGYALGAPLVNLFYDISGTYNVVLSICAVLMLSVCVSFRFVLREVEKVKEEVAAKLAAAEK